MIRFVTLLLLSVLSLGACGQQAAAPGADASTAMADQLIIKFRKPVAAPDAVAFVKQLSEDAGVTLHFTRTLATGAQLYSIAGNPDVATVNAVIQHLQQRADIEYVEQDRRVPPAPKP